MVTPNPTIDVSEWEVIGLEPLGSKPHKTWLRSSDDDRKWLFKPRTMQLETDREFPKGDDWAEKVSAEVARALEIPAADVELAEREGDPGIVSADVSGERDLVLGNVVLYEQDPDYDHTQRHGVAGYTVEAIFSSLRAHNVVPAGTVQDIDACSVFAGYLLLDALVANTDRHHENWGILVDPAGTSPPVLAPTFDHASSLGFQLSDDERSERLATRDRNRTVEAYAGRGRSRHFAGNPTLVELAVEAVSACGPDVEALYAERVQRVGTTLEEVVAAIPPIRMSHPSRIFAVRLLLENRRRLLDGLASAR